MSSQLPPPRCDSAAQHELARALNAAGWHANAAQPGDGSITIVLTSPDDPELWGSSDGLPDQDLAPLRQFLAEHGISATVALLGDDLAGVRLTVAGAADAARLAEIVARTMRPEHQAAQHLKNTLLDAELVRAVDVAVAAVSGGVDIGHLDLEFALQLWALLDDSGGAARFDPERADWRDIAEIAAAMQPVIAAVCGEDVPVSPDPACRSCSLAREHQIVFGEVSSRGANRLAAAIINAPGPGHVRRTPPSRSRRSSATPQPAETHLMPVRTARTR
ncbi:hypothetical protein ACFCY8_10260 [Streptomyces noursei]|uniref:hypothetical protein n=1 Tax=Streptomyces noursei TaxID=1971 RepID=UPI0035DE2B7A